MEKNDCVPWQVETKGNGTGVRCNTVSLEPLGMWAHFSCSCDNEKLEDDSGTPMEYRAGRKAHRLYQIVTATKL